jgi:hypothetical protein
VSRDFFASGFYHESVSPSPRVFRKDRFKFFQKFPEIFASQGAPPVSMTQAANFSISFAANLPVSMKLVANCHWYQ